MIDWGKYADEIIKASAVQAHSLPFDFYDAANDHIFNYILKRLPSYKEEKASPRTYICRMADFGKLDFIKLNMKSPIAHVRNTEKLTEVAQSESPLPFTMEDIPADIRNVAYALADGKHQTAILRECHLTRHQYFRIRRELRDFLAELMDRDNAAPNADTYRTAMNAAWDRMKEGKK